MGATFFNLAGLLLKGRGTFIAEPRMGVKESMRTAAETPDPIPLNPVHPEKRVDIGGHIHYR